MRLNHVNEENCEKYGRDPEKVEQLARRLKSVADACEREQISIFAGCFGGLVLRAWEGCGQGQSDNLADSISSNCDGGDGGD